MVVKQLIVSDMSGEEVPEEAHARVVVRDHPLLDRGTPVELDISTDEAERFQAGKIDLVSVTVYEPDRAPRIVVLDAQNFNSMFRGSVEEVLDQARKATGSAAQDPSEPRRRGPRKSGARQAAGPRSDRVDYQQPETFGQLHRGRVTEEEARMVRENAEQASANRQKQTGAPIDWEDAKERKRYGLEAPPSS